MKNFLFVSFALMASTPIGWSQVDAATKSAPLLDSKGSSQDADPTALKTMQAALAFRVEMASAIIRKTETPAGALDRLRARAGASGLALAGEADFALAVLDVGHRLLASDRPEAAEVFFRAAEQAFATAARQTPDDQVREKVGFLQKLALVRGKYLNQAAQARADIDEAIRLQPEDPALRQVRSQLARGQGETFKSVDVGAVKK